MHKYALVHVPKTGGTSLNYVLKESCNYFQPGVKLLEQTSLVPDYNFYRRCALADYCYITGHIPSSILQKNYFDKIITVIREPVDLLASFYGFLRLSKYYDDGGIFSGVPIYAPYFAPRFFLERFCIEISYGYSQTFTNYFQCESPESAFEQLCLFDVVVDFDDFDHQIKDFIVNDGLYPFSRLPLSRKHDYDKQAAREFALSKVTSFDLEFYALYLANKKKSSNSDLSYEEYRLGFANQYGIDMVCGSDVSYDLSLPVGLGWYPMELSDLGQPFRWGESESTVEIPLRNKGQYRLFFYFANCKPTELDYSISFEPSGFLSNGSLNDMVGITKMLLEIRLEVASWVVIKLSVPPRVPEHNSTELRDCALTLGHICIERLV